MFNKRTKIIENVICFVRMRKLEKLEKYPTLLISDYRNITSKRMEKLSLPAQQKDFKNQSEFWILLNFGAVPLEVWSTPVYPPLLVHRLQC